MDQHTMKVSDLYDIAIFDISRDGEQWRKYLEFSARGNLYRFDFLNTCIIYEQYPEAEILLGFSDWKKAKRYVRGGEIGIATFPIEMLGGAQYVYDIKSTGGRVMPWIWEINEENAPAFAKKLFPEQYQEENNFRIAIKNFTRTYVRAIMEEENDRIHEIAVLTSKDELDDNQMSPVEEFILQSTAYLVLRRCGIDTFDTGLSAITNYREEVILSKIGILISDIAERTLRRFAEIAKEIREDERRNQDGRTELQERTGRATVSDVGDREPIVGRSGDAGQIREAGTGLPAGEGQEQVQPAVEDRQATGAVETDRSGGVGTARQNRGELRENEGGGTEYQSGGYHGNDQTSERSGNDSPGNRDAGSYLQAEVIETDIEEGAAVAVPSFSVEPVPAEVTEELRREVILAVTLEPMLKKRIYDFFELNEGIGERVEFLYQIYEGGDTIITGEGLEFEYETDDTGIQLYWHEQEQYLSGYLPFKIAAEEILLLIERGEYYQPIKKEAEIPEPLAETVENFLEVADGKVVFNMIYDVMTVNLLPQQETEFIRQSFLALLGSGGGWTFASTLVFHKEDISYSVEDKEIQTYPWRVIRDILAHVIELDQYPESSPDLSVEELSQFPWFQNLAAQYQGLLEQAGEIPAVEIPYLSADTEIEKGVGEAEDTEEEIQEAQADERGEQLKAVFEEAANSYALHSMALIPSKSLIQRFFEQAGEKEKQEFLSEILKVQSKRDNGRSALNTSWGLIHYTYGESGTIEFRLVNGENERHGTFTMQEVSRAIQAAINAGEYLPPGEYEVSCEEEFALCPEETFQLYKEMSNRNQNVIQVSDFFYPDGWEFPSGDKAKYKSNVAAIRLLKELEQSSRPATPEEQDILAKYIGWGGLANAFNPKSPNWTNEYQELQMLLTEEEYEQARGSINSAFYTPPIVAKTIYKALEQFGFTSGSILEPSMGVGNFYSVLPETMRDSWLYGVELDSISGRIAKQLHPHAAIEVKGFEKTKFEKNSFDVIVGNVPFGAYKIFDPEYKKYGFRIHDYFLAKSMDLLRPGGIIAVVTAKFTMDKANSTIRKYLAERADFIGAVRLPGIAFKKDAGAEITSDIIFLQKKGRVLSPNTSEEWMNITYTDDGVPVNEYFMNHPEMMLGKMAFDRHTHGPNSNYTELIVENEEHFDFEEQLNHAISFLSAAYVPAEEKLVLPDVNSKEELPNTMPALLDVANNTYTDIEGEIYYRDNDIMVRWSGNETQRNRILGMHAIRQAVRYLIDIQTQGCSTDQLVEAQERLNKVYDPYVKKYGYLSSRANKLAFREDNDYYLLCSLETEDENKNIKKADIFYKQTIAPIPVIEKVDTAMDALQVSLAEYGKVHIPYMLSIYPVERERLLQELKGQIFLNPVKVADGNPNQGWETASEYLSGPVRKKLKVAEAYEKVDPIYFANVEALKAVQPEDLTATEITVKLGTSWIAQEDYEAFIYETLNTPDQYRDGTYAIKVQLNRYTMSYKVTNKSSDYSSVAASQTYGTKRIDAYSIIEALLNQNVITVKDKIEVGDSERYVVNQKETTLAREKATLIKDAFKEWIWKDPQRRKKYVEFYNQNFNDNRLRVYDGSYLSFPGMNPEINMRDHQRNVVDRALHGSTLLAHAVGAGKTYEIAAICMELKRLKLMHKAMIVVPNHLVGQMASEFLYLYPSANLLVTSKDDFKSENRKKLTCRIAANNYDAVILGHSQFERIPLSAERRAEILENQIERISGAIAEMKEEQGAKWGIKDMERQRKNLESQILSLRNDAKKDDVLDFEQLGIDALFVDEAHVFKNLSIFSKIRNVAGISTNGSQRAMDMFQKIQYIQELTGGRNVILATGTPISNTMCEMYVMQLYLQSQKLHEKGIDHFDSWAANFGEVTTSLEMSPEGGYRMRSRFNKFCNLPELMNMFREVADIQLPSMLNLNVPKLKDGRYKIVESVASESVEYMMQELAGRAEAIRAGNVDPTVDNMLKITNEARLLGTDPRLIDPDAEVDGDGKLFQAAENIYQEYIGSQEFKGTQVAFCDIGTPTGTKKFNVYDFLKQELIRKGIPEDEIAFIHDAHSDKQKEELFADMRTGRKRILLGSTSMMGTGTNIQKRLCAAHHIDCPWKPSDIEQREGRIIRHGNDNEEVNIYRYITKKTFDSYLWGIVENKQRFISQIMTDKTVERECQDVDETILSFAEIKAIASGNPMIMEKTEVDTEVSRLQVLKASYESQRYVHQDNFLFKYPELINKTESRLHAIGKDIRKRDQELCMEPDFFVTLNGLRYDEREAAGSVILEIAHSLESMESRTVGSYKGFDVVIQKKYSDCTISLSGELTYSADMSSSASGNMVRMENLLGGLEKRVAAHKEKLEEYKRNMEESKREFNKEFPYESDLKQKLIRQQEINNELEIKDEGEELVVTEELPEPAMSR